MQITDRTTLITEWVDVANAHDLDRYLTFFTDDVVLDDPSVGRSFRGKEGIAEYFTAYFIGFDTRTSLSKIEAQGEVLHVEVDFTGSFPGGHTGGFFDLTFADSLIAHVRADLT
ncbi:nuclear transport factor 2 family protein [Herbiconiux sp. P16]|uniref:nuclear transport factor 2 family protein n=1 Tax=Herbiconiux wuyangfengii TaxID=3342794 RepID=UPI0035BB7FEF